MNKKHLKNLEKLADFLETEVTDEQFKIDYYLLRKDEIVTPDEVVPECGTVGCALGWSSSLFYKEALKHHFWSEYSNEVFGCSVHDNTGKYMFGAKQKPTEKSRKATIKRIKKVVANKGKL